MAEEDFQQEDELAKDLGFKEALTIGVGVMIGAGIFILPSHALGNAGPAAILSYLLAAVIAMISAASTAEVSTGMPKSGGLYYFISRALGSFWGTIAGVALWLSLAIAVAFYLQGFGEYLARILPFQANHILIGFITGIIFIAINYRGVKESGSTQNIITGSLVLILLVFFILGIFYVDTSNLTPFFPFGPMEIFPVTALVFVSFIGFGEIAAVAEEVQDPGKNMPRALLGAVIIPTTIYVAVLVVAAGLIPFEEIIGIEAPIVEAARMFSGGIGALVITFAALLATASSANASILASSRIGFAMGRDDILPGLFNDVHEKYYTPYKAILITGAITIFLVLTADVESLSKAAGVLTLISYALVNISLIVLRLRPPEDYRPSFLCPGYPYLQILGAISSIAVIFLAEPAAQITTLVLIAISVIWYYTYGKKRSQVKGISTEIDWKTEFSFVNTPDNLSAALEGYTPSMAGREFSPYHVLTAVANPASGRSLIDISSKLIDRTSLDSEVSVLNILEVPSQLPLRSAKNREDIMQERTETQSKLFNITQEMAAETGVAINPRVKYSRDRYKTMYNTIKDESIDFLMLGWHGAMNVSKISRSMVGRLVRTAPCRVGVLKDRGINELDKFCNILVPFRGSEHAKLGFKLAADFAEEDDCNITVLRVINPGADKEKEKQEAKKEIEALNTGVENYKIKVVENRTVADGIITETRDENYDLVIMGASKQWRYKNMLFGSIPDLVTDSVETSVLMVRDFDQSISKTVEEEAKAETDDSPGREEPEKI